MIKPKNLVMLGAESYLGRALRATFLRYFLIFKVYSYTTLINETLGLPRTELSSAASPGHFVLYIFELGP